MGTLFIVICWFLLGAASAYWAQIKGRDPLAWFVIGLFFGLISLAVLYFLPPLEQKEPLKEEFQIEKSLPNPLTLKEWYYLNAARETKGPISYGLLVKEIEEGILSPDTLVWCDEMADWKSAKEALPHV